MVWLSSVVACFPYAPPAASGQTEEASPCQAMPVTGLAIFGYVFPLAKLWGHPPLVFGIVPSLFVKGNNPLNQMEEQMGNTHKNNNKQEPFRKRVGRLNVTVFENLSKKNEIYFSTYIQRRYETNGVWKEGPLSEQDLEDLPQAKQVAEAYIAEQKQRYSKQQLPQPEDPSWVADTFTPGTTAA